MLSIPGSRTWGFDFRRGITLKNLPPWWGLDSRDQYNSLDYVKSWSKGLDVCNETLGYFFPETFSNDPFLLFRWAKAGEPIRCRRLRPFSVSPQEGLESRAGTGIISRTLLHISFLIETTLFCRLITSGRIAAWCGLSISLQLRPRSPEANTLLCSTDHLLICAAMPAGLIY